MKLKWIIILVFISTKIFCQNNPIFLGGSGSGYKIGSTLEATINIFLGGGNDGHSANNFIQPTVSIFLGGQGDGFLASGTIQTTGSIFVGGQGDGYSADGIIQSTATIFGGGAGDGFNTINILEPTTSIFSGGAGDGWFGVVFIEPIVPLPLTLIKFDGYKNKETNVLSWSTSHEMNTAYFELERSENLTQFESIGHILTKNNTETNSYSFVDEQPDNGLNYYRLKIIDLDHKFFYSKIIALDFSKNEMATVFPNPAIDILNINWPSQNENLTISIYNSAGQFIKRLYAKANEMRGVNISNLATGKYFINISSNKIQQNLNFIKQ